MSVTDWYCSRCSLQFDKKVIFDMHLSIVHKEIVKIKEESITFEDEPNLATEKLCRLVHQGKRPSILKWRPGMRPVPN